MFKIRLLTKEVYKHSFTKNYKNIINKNRITYIKYDKQCLLQVYRVEQLILTSKRVLLIKTNNPNRCFYLLICMIYYMNINTNNQNNSKSVR